MTNHTNRTLDIDTLRRILDHHDAVAAMVDEASQTLPQHTSTTPEQPTDIIDRIDTLIDVCGHCGRDLAADNASMDFCSENCQSLWQASRAEAPLLPGEDAELAQRLSLDSFGFVFESSGQEPVLARVPLAPSRAPMPQVPSRLDAAARDALQMFGLTRR